MNNSAICQNKKSTQLKTEKNARVYSKKNAFESAYDWRDFNL